MVHSDTKAISTYFLSRKRRKVSGTSSAESNWVGYLIEDIIEGESHESFDVSGEVLKFSFQKRELLWVINVELLGDYCIITRELLGNYWVVTE